MCVAKKSPLAVYNHKEQNGNGYIKITEVGMQERRKLSWECSSPMFCN